MRILQWRYPSPRCCGTRNSGRPKRYEDDGDYIVGIRLHFYDRPERLVRARTYTRVCVFNIRACVRVVRMRNEIKMCFYTRTSTRAFGSGRKKWISLYLQLFKCIHYVIFVIIIIIVVAVLETRCFPRVLHAYRQCTTRVMYVIRWTVK